MDNKQLLEKTLEIAKILFESSELYISRSEVRNHLQGEFEPYYGLITKSLCASDKIIKNRGRAGGLEYAKGKYHRSKLSAGDEKKIREKFEHLLKELKNSENKENNQPELKVQEAFKNWFQKQEIKIDEADFVYNFRSGTRKNSKWRNVDGYYITFEKSDYHLNFKPVLTSFEVKAGMPNITDISQATNYFEFSHYVYLIFNSDEPAHQIQEKLSKAGLRDDSKLGIFVTSDNISFIKVQQAKLNQPLILEVEQALKHILADGELESIEGKLLEYLQDKIKLLLS